MMSLEGSDHLLYGDILLGFCDSMIFAHVHHIQYMHCYSWGGDRGQLIVNLLAMQ